MSWRANPRLQDLNRACRKEMATYRAESTGPSDALCTEDAYVCDVFGCNDGCGDEAGLVRHCQTVSHLAILQQLCRGASPSPWALLKLPPDSSADQV